MDAQGVLATALAEQKVRIYWDARVPHAVPASEPGGVGAIHLPPLPDVVDERAERLLRAYTGHEAGHLRYTEAATPLSIDDETLFTIWNFIEDGRINKLVGDQFLGLKLDLELVYEDSGEELAARLKEAAKHGEKVSAITRALGVLTFVGMEVDDEKIRRWSNLDENVVRLLESIPDVIERLTTLKSAADALECARVVYDRWQQALADEAPPPPPKGHEGKGDGKGPSGGFPYPSKDKAGKPGPDGDDESVEPGEEKAAGGKKEEPGAEDEAPGAPLKPGGGGDDEGPDEKKKGGAKEKSKKKLDGLLTSDPEEPTKHTIEDEEFVGKARSRKGAPEDERGEPPPRSGASLPSVDVVEERRPKRTRKALEEAARVLREAAELSKSLTIGERLTEGVVASVKRSYKDAASNPERVYVAWREQDEIVDIPKTPNSGTARLYEDARSRVAFLRSRLLTELLGMGPMWARGQTRGKIDDRRLYRAALKDRQIFKRKRAQPTMNTAVELLIDYSGSMAEGVGLRRRKKGESRVPEDPESSGMTKVDLAIRLAMLFSETCDLLDVANEVTAFTTNPLLIDPLGRPEVFTRWEPLRLMVLKPFEAKFKACVHAFANAKSMGLYNNVDGESVLWAARRLAEREEENLVLIVLSDGMPHANGCNMDGIAAHLRGAVQRVKHAGIRVLAFGINSEAVKHFYGDDYVVFNRIDDLVTGGYARIAQILRAARRVSVPR